MRTTSLWVRFLHSEAFYAVAQKKYVFIYDQDGVEVQYVLACSFWFGRSDLKESDADGFGG